MIKNLSFIVFLFFCYPATAQNPEWVIYNIDTIPVGIDGGNAGSIEKGIDSRAWIYTGYGIYATNDGKNWDTLFYYKDGSPRYLDQYKKRTNFVEDANGNWWAGSDEGLLKHENGEWILKDIVGSPIKNGGWLRIDNTGDFWLLQNDTSVYKFNLTEWEKIAPPTYTDETASVFYVDKNRNVWVGYMWGTESLYRYNGAVWDSFNTANSDLSDNWVTAMAEDNNGLLWIGTGHGFNSFDGTNWQTFTVANSGCAGDFVHDIDIDSSNKVYIGTLSGLSIYDGSTFTNFTKDNSPLPANNIGSLYMDANQNLWMDVGNSWLAIYNPNGVEFVKATTVPSLPVSRKEDKIKIYPNPAKNTLTISPLFSGGDKGEAIFILYDLLGKEVKRAEIKQEATIDISNIKAGLYLYKIEGTKIKGKLSIIK